jgi:hypothetical protein
MDPANNFVTVVKTQSLPTGNLQFIRGIYNGKKFMILVMGMSVIVAFFILN